VSMDHIVTLAPSPPRDLHGGFDVFKPLTITRKMKHINQMSQRSQLLDLLVYKCPGTLIARMRIHGRDHQDFQTHSNLALDWMSYCFRATDDSLRRKISRNHFQPAIRISRSCRAGILRPMLVRRRNGSVPNSFSNAIRNS